MMSLPPLVRGSIAALCVLLAGPAFAQLNPVGDELVVNPQSPASFGVADGSSEQFVGFGLADAALNDDGVLFVAWAGLPSGVDQGIFGRAWDPAAASPAAIVRLDDGSARAVLPPRVARVGDGFLAVWYAREPEGRVLRGRFLSASGTPLDEPILLSDVPIPGEVSVALAVYGESTLTEEGSFVVAWAPLEGDAQADSIFLRGFDPEGRPVGPSSSIDGWAIPALVPTEGAESLLVRAVDQGTGMPGALRGAPFAFPGSAVGDDVQIVASTDRVDLGSVTKGPGDGLFAFWQADAQRWFRRLDFQGRPRGPARRVDTLLGGEGLGPHGAAPLAGRALAVAGVERIATPGPPGGQLLDLVIGQLLGPGGAPLVDPFIVGDAGEGSSVPEATVVANERGEAVFLWNRFREDYQLPCPLSPCPFVRSFDLVAKRYELEAGATPTVLSLQGGRIEASLSWKDPFGGSGEAEVLPISDETGAFYFRDADNLEVVLKVLDGGSLNGHYWGFVGSMTNVEFELRVTDTSTRETRTLTNPQGRLRSLVDTRLLPQAAPVRSAEMVRVSAPLDSSQVAEPVGGAAMSLPSPCATDEALCLLTDRFLVSMTWRDPRTGRQGVARGMNLTDAAGYFHFGDERNVEVMLKMLDARTVNGHFWLFFGTMTDLELSVRVEDTETGQVRVFDAPAGGGRSIAELRVF